METFKSQLPMAQGRGGSELTAVRHERQGRVDLFEICIYLQNPELKKDDCKRKLLNPLKYAWLGNTAKIE